MGHVNLRVETALANVVVAARDHLAAVAAGESSGVRDHEALWRAYVALNNATYRYAEVLLEAYGEVAPWQVDWIDPTTTEPTFPDEHGHVTQADPHPSVISVRQRRDYRVSSASSLIRLAEDARGVTGDAGDGPVGSVGEAVLVLVQLGDGTLASLDLPELEPFEGVVTVFEVGRRLALDALARDDGEAPFRAEPSDRLVGRLDERPAPAATVASRSPAG
ncbi:hypothetical protein ACFFX1_39085 [Dactylosporangium sucinum]|nr:hypothetical protein [Dactylosporangium sucinum]